MTTALRSFLQYARYLGEVTLDLAAAVPIVANWSMTSIPRAIAAEHVRQLLASIDRRTAIGRRDYAILLLLARLGLRSGEVAFLELDDIDWNAGQVERARQEWSAQRSALTHGSWQSDRRVPAAGRPRSTSRRVFLRAKAPIRGFRGASGVGSIVRHSLQRAGIEAPTYGAHQFRHGLATEMLRQGASLGEIGELLGHRQSPDHQDLHQGRSQGPAYTRLAVAGRCAMNTLRQAVQEYLSLRRSLGFKLREAGKGLLDFVTVHGAAPRFLHHQAVGAGLGSTTSERSTGALGATTEFRTRIRALSQCHRSTNADSAPRACCHSDRSGRDLTCTPTKRSAAYCAPLSTCPVAYERGKLRPWIYYCLFGLLSVSGLRLGEARNLELQDVDLKAAVLTIRGAKFGKTRLVPLHASTCTVLADYIARRKRHWAGRPVSSYLFVSSWGNRLDGGEIHRTFYALSRQIGLRGTSDSHGPRLHDMRHRFATNTLVRGIGPIRIQNAACRSCPPTSVMSTSPTRSGI